MPATEPPPPLIAAQIRAARALLDWPQAKLAQRAGLSLSTIRDYESERRGGVIGGLKAIRETLENAGITFLPGEPAVGPGVRLKPRRPNVLRVPTKLAEGDALVFRVEWRGRTAHVVVPPHILEDLAEMETTPSETQALAIFHKHRGQLLDAAATAIDSNRVTPDRRVYLEHEDFQRFSTKRT